MSTTINYRQQWFDGEIEAGTLLDAIDALAQRCREIEAQRDAAAEAAGNTASANHKLLLERDHLRAEVERYKVMSDNYCALAMDSEAEAAKLRAEVERLNLHVEKAQQHALTMGNKALELAAREIELQVEVDQMRQQAAISLLKVELPAT